MFANNEQISWKQLYSQMVLGYAGALVLVLPGEGGVYGLPGALAGIIAMIILILYCFWLVRLAPAYSHLERYVGEIGKKIVGTVFLLFFLLTSAYLIAVIQEVTSIYMNTKAPVWVIHVMIILTCAMAGIPQIQRRGRLAEFVFPFLITVLGAMIIMAFVQNRGDFWGYVMQRKYMDVDTIIFDSYKILTVCTCVGAVPFILGNVRGRKYAGLVSAIGTIFLFLVGTIILLQGSYGQQQVMSRKWPVLSIMASIRVPGGFVARMDPIWLALILLLLLFSVGSTFFYSNYIIRRTELKIPWYVVYGLVFVLSLMQIGKGTVREIYLPVAGMFFTPVLFLWNVYLGIRMRMNKHEK